MSETRIQQQNDLLQVLLEEHLITEAQAAVVKADVKVTDLPVEEILLTRKWITEETLRTLPLQVTSFASTELTSRSASDDEDKIYQENLQRYRRLMAEIMGEA